MAKKQPNIIFLFSDQQRWDTVGCYGHNKEMEVTPNLDQLAASGVKFEHAFTCQSVCGPARSCIQTGKYATETGCFRNNIGLSENEKTIAHYLGDNGYKLVYVGKWHLASIGPPTTVDWNNDDPLNFHNRPIPLHRRGGWNDYWVASDVLEFTSHSYDGYLFDHNMEKRSFTAYRADALTDFALEFIRNIPRETPFLLFLSFIEPHHQNDHNRYEAPEGVKERFKNFSAPGDLKDRKGDWREEYPDYLGCCWAIDRNVGRILQKLSRLGIRDNTVILYTSDHGSHFRTRNRNIKPPNYDDYKRTCHESAIRIPLIIQGPGFEGGKTINKLVSLIDIAPTILDIAGIEKPDDMHGSSLRQLFLHEDLPWRDSVFVQISESQLGRAIRTAKWKYSVKAPDRDGNYYMNSRYYEEDFLYDLEMDPHEKNNLVDRPEYKVVKTQLAAMLIDHMKKANENIPVIGPPIGTRQ